MSKYNIRTVQLKKMCQFCLTKVDKVKPYFCPMKIMSRLFPFALLIIMGSCNNTDTNVPEDTKPPLPVISYNIVSVHPHDTSRFTQGLEFYKGTLVESTGLNGRSRIVQQEFPGGKVLREVPLDSRFFGEGVTILNDTAYQLTWQQRVVHLYAMPGFKKIKELPLNTDGWGITNDGKRLIVSDGSSNLYYYEPGTFRLLTVQTVSENDAPAVNLNELEYINGFVYANQWQYNYILKIDPSNGKVVAKMDLSDIVRQVQAKAPYAEVLNGIAHNPETGKVYITGKNWPEMFEIAFAH